ncbi:hypothetical protein WG66_003164 [Moniliophthora roreri]|nr:hypothetical protein WG66_003164 [Moniliophthora roreri]
MVKRGSLGSEMKARLKDINVTFLVSSRVVSSGFALGSEPLVYRLSKTLFEQPLLALFDL